MAGPADLLQGQLFGVMPVNKAEHLLQGRQVLGGRLGRRGAGLLARQQEHLLPDAEDQALGFQREQRAVLAPGQFHQPVQHLALPLVLRPKDQKRQGLIFQHGQHELLLHPEGGTEQGGMEQQTEEGTVRAVRAAGGMELPPIDKDALPCFEPDPLVVDVIEQLPRRHV